MLAIGLPAPRTHRRADRRMPRRPNAARAAFRAGRSIGSRWTARFALACLALSALPGLDDAARAQQADTSVPVPYSWELKPRGLFARDRFRLLFITDEKFRASSGAISTYDYRIWNALAAGHQAIRDYRRYFRAVVSNANVDARDNISATGDGVPIYWLNGLRAARNYPDFFDTVVSETPKDETGGNSSGGNFWTGSRDDGTKYPVAWVGESHVSYGNLNSGLNVGLDTHRLRLRLLGMSPVFRVLPRNATYVTGLTISSAPEHGNSYRTGETIEVTVTYNAAVTVDSAGGTPQLALTIGSNTRNAVYSATGSTATALVFAYTVVEQDYDDNGISIGGHALGTNGGSIKKRGAEAEADLFVFGLTGQLGHRVNYLGDRGLVLSAASLEAPEGGAVSYTVKLATRPTGTVTVALGGISGTELTLDRTGLSFTASNWSAAQTVTVSAADDDDMANDKATLTHAASGGGYNGVSKDLPVTVKDDDEAGLVLSAASLEAPEGGSVGYTVKLATRPTGTVTVALGGISGTELTLDRTGLSFTASNWSAAQTVTVSAADDDDMANDKATLTHAASGGGYGGVSKDLPVTVKDDDEAGLVLSVSSLGIAEEDEGSYTVKLATRPTGTVTVALGGAAGTELTLDKTGLSFTASNWSAAQTVTVSAAADDDATDDEATLTHAASGGGYNGVSKDFAVRVTDNDQPGLVLSAASLEAPEGGSVGYTLATRPTGTVTVALGGISGTELTLDRTGLSFTASNWSAAQTVTVSAADDDDMANDKATLTHAASGGGYNGVSKDLPVTVKDDDEAGLVLSAASLEAPEGGSVGYTVKLATRPTGTVTVALGGISGTELTLDRTGLSFTASNWSAAQTVTVSAADDDDMANDKATLTHAASGGGYNGVSKDLPVTVKDDDEAGLVLSAASLEAPEGGAVSYTVKLATRPTGPVTVRLGGAAGTDLSLDKASLSFTVSDWSAAQTVTVSAAGDDDGADDKATLTHAASGGGHDTVSKDLPVTVIDDDKPELIVSVSALGLPEGGDGRYTVKLATHPGGPVTVTLTCPPETDLAFREDRLTFTPSDWHRAQTVFVMVAEDDDRDDDVETVTHTASGGGYNGVSKKIAVKVADNDTRDPALTGWLARFGRSVAYRAVDAIASRFEGGGPQLRIAGQPVGGADRRSMAEDGDGAAGDFARPAASHRSRTMTARSLLLGSSFRFSAGEEDDRGAWSAWGRAVGGGFEGYADGARVDGETISAFLGADLATPRWTAGLAIGLSQGDGSLASVGDNGTRSVESSLTTIHPYGRLRLTERIDVWGMLGWGAGELTLRGAAVNGGARQKDKTDIAMRMGAVGARGELLAPGEAGGLALALKSDLLWLQTESEAAPGDGSRLAESQADVGRLRLLLKGSRAFPVDGGAVIPAAEIGVRHEGGDADTGTGIELGGSIRYAGAGFSIEGAARGLVAHTETGYEEWGASGAISIDPDGSRRGLSLRIAPVLGAASSGVDRLWSVGDATGLAEAGAFAPRARLEAEIGYGLRAPEGHGTITPQAGLSLAGRGERVWRLEAGWEDGSNAALTIEATRREAANDNEVGYGLMLRGALRW